MEFLSLLGEAKQGENHQKHQIRQAMLQENPLHTAALRGDLELTKQLLTKDPELSKSLDSKGSSALHLASAKGDLKIVKELVSVNSSMCCVLDGEGRSPLHLAAIKGRVEVLGELLKAAAAAAAAAAVLTDRGESCLHLCVKYNRLEAMKMILQCLEKVDRLVDWKDELGNTVLHLAVTKKQIEIVKCLLDLRPTQTDARNANGLTPLDLLLQSPGDFRDLEIKKHLEDRSCTRTGLKKSTTLDADFSKASRNRPKKHKHTDWLSRKRNALMIVASLLATVAFQAGLSPPGGVWQGDFAGNPNSTRRVDRPHEAGKSVMAYTLPSKYGQYMICNTIAFLASLSIILLQVSGLPMRRRRWMWTQMVIMWIAITAQTLTYFITVINMTPRHVERAAYHMARICVLIWLVLMGVVFVGNITRGVLYLLREHGYIERKETGIQVYEEDDQDDDAL